MARQYSKAQLTKQGVDALADYFGVVATSAQVRALLDADCTMFSALRLRGVDATGRRTLIDAVAKSVGMGEWPSGADHRSQRQAYFAAFNEKATAAGWALTPNFLGEA